MFKAPWQTWCAVRVGATALEGGEGSERTLCLLSVGWSIQPVHGMDPLLGAWQPRPCRPVSSCPHPPMHLLLRLLVAHILLTCR